MHCDKNNIISKYIEYIPLINKRYFKSCKEHNQHHLDVEPDMKINNKKNIDKVTLFMGWYIFIPLFLAILICSLLSKKISNSNISYTSLFIFSIIITFVWEYLWNKVHIKMHQYEMDYSIKYGPYDENVFKICKNNQT
jgi:hypothetical protein